MITDMSQDAPIDIRSFKGINLREPAGMIQDDELSLCVNFDIGRAGELVKRTGFAVLHSGSTLGNNPTKLIGHFLTSANSQLIVQSGTKLYYSADGATWTEIGTYSVEFGAQYNQKFYMVRKAGTVLEWDGSAITALAGSPNGTFCQVYKDRLFVLSSEATGALNSRLYYSSAGDFSTWPSTNFIDVKKGDGDFLTCCAVIHDLLIIFKGRTTWALYVQGSPENWVLRNINPEIGCISKFTPREIEGFLFFTGARGVYKTDGITFEDISESILPVFSERIVNLTNANIDTAAWWDDRYILLFNPTPSSQRWFVYHLRTGGWTEWVPNGIKPATFLEINTAAPQKGLYCGDLDSLGKILRFGGGAYTDAGTNYECRFETKDFDFTMPSLFKRGKWLMLDVEGLSSVDIVYTSDGTVLTTRSFSSVVSRRGHKISGPGYFRRWKMKLSQTSNVAFTFYGSTIFMHKKRAVVKAST